MISIPTLFHIMAWSQAYRSILKGAINQYVEAHDRKSKDAVMSIIVQDIQKAHQNSETTRPLPKKLDKVCPFKSFCFDYLLVLQKVRTWLNNYAQSKRSRVAAETTKGGGNNEHEECEGDEASQDEPDYHLPHGDRKFAKLYKLRDAIPILCKREVEFEVQRLSGASPGTKVALKFYPQAISTVMDQLTEDKLKEVEDIVKIWNTHGAPKAVQIRCVN
jgi:hypothetical protein